jgi:hypothetical protein
MQQGRDQVGTATTLDVKPYSSEYGPRAKSRGEMNAMNSSLADRLLFNLILVFSLIFIRISLVFVNMFPAAEAFSSEVKSIALW